MLGQLDADLGFCVQCLLLAYMGFEMLRPARFFYAEDKQVAYISHCVQSKCLQKQSPFTVLCAESNRWEWHV